MTLDISLQAIEADLAIAERGGQVADLAMARAQVRATLLAASLSGGQGREVEPATPVWVNDTGQDILIAEGPDSHVFTVPKAAAWDDRVTAAAMLLRLDEPALRNLLAAAFGPHGVSLLPEPVLEAPAEPDDDVDDVFAEARQARRKK